MFGAGLFQVKPSGDVFWSRRITQQLECPMSFTALPFDEQHCTMVMGSYTETTEVVVLELKGDPVPGWTLAKTVSHAEWSVEKVEARVKKNVWATGSFDSALLTFHVDRKDMFFMYSYVLNSILFVLISYSGFYINRTVAPARVAISVIPVLIMRVLDNSVKAGMPKIGQLTWLTSFLLMSMGYCQAAVFEYAVVGYFLRQEVVAGERFAGLKEISAQLAKREADGASRDAESGEAAPQAPPHASGQRAPLEIDDSARSPLVASRAHAVPSKITDLSGLSASQVIAIDMAFCDLDPQDTGAVSRAGMRQGLNKCFDKYYTARQVQEIFDKLRLRHDDNMSPHAFVSFLRQLPTPTQDPQKEFHDHPMSQRLDLFMRRFFVWSFLSCVIMWFVGTAFL